MNTNDLLKLLAGKKTYLIAFAGIAYLLWCQHTGQQPDNMVLEIFGFLGLGTLRHGVASTLASLAPADPAAPVPGSVADIQRRNGGFVRLHVMLTLAALSVALLLLTAGCSGFTVAPGADPVVVHAEQSLSVSRDALDAFVQYDYAHRKDVPANVHAAAEAIRREAPAKFRAAAAILDAYQANRSPENLATLNTYVSALEELAKQANAITK